MHIIYQDNRIAVIEKPVGLLSEQMPDLLRQELGTACFRTVHRLDAQVGGLMVLGRSVKAASLLSEQMAGRRFTKEYLAVVRGDPPDRGQLRDYLARDTQKGITYVVEGPSKEAKEALLSYETVAKRAGLTLVRVRLHTGRTHQIRVQFASRGWPLYGDKKYGQAEVESIALYCCHLGFTHPQTGEELDFTLSPTGGIWDMFA